MFDSLIAKFAGKWIAKKADLREGTMDTKAWYKSKTIWSDIATVAISIVGLVDVHFAGGKIALSPIYQTILAVLGGMGIYTRSTATTKIG
jgi:hypothetical protein